MPQSRELNDMAEVRILNTAAVETVALKELASELIEEVRFASGKAKAHLHDSRAFPMPANRDALECILKNRDRFIFYPSTALPPINDIAFTLDANDLRHC